MPSVFAEHGSHKQQQASPAAKTTERVPAVCGVQRLRDEAGRARVRGRFQQADEGNREERGARNDPEEVRPH